MSRRLRTVLLILLLCACGGFFVMRTRAASNLTAFTKAQFPPTQIHWREGAWYWLEADPKASTRLMRADNNAVKPIATAEKIAAYSVANGKVAWAAKEGAKWSLVTSAQDGSGTRTLYSGSNEIRGVSLAAEKIFWVEQIPPAIPGGGPLPPLGPTLKLLSFSTDGGTPQPIATLFESDGGQIIGVHAEHVYISALRQGSPGMTINYRVSLKDGSVGKVSGEAGQHPAVIQRNGQLIWAGLSREDARIGPSLCIRRFGQNGEPETIAEWLPTGGQLFDTPGGVYYVDKTFDGDAWVIPDSRDLPRGVALPRQYTVLAVGDNELLLGSANATPADIPLYRIPRP